MEKIAIVTDSNSGILPAEVEGRDIFILPMPIIINGQEYFEDISLTQDEFYEKLNQNADVSTSQPSLFNVSELWEKLLKDYDRIIHIPMSSGLSASCENAIQLSKDFGGKVVVVDNQRISITLKQSVNDAEKMVKDGKSVDEIAKYLIDTKLDSSIYIMIPTLKYLKKGGRLTPAAAMIGSLLNIKPVLQIQGGKLDSFAKVLSIKQAYKAMINAIKEDVLGRFSTFAEEGNIRFYLAYTKDLDSVNLFKEQVETSLGIEIDFINPLSLSVASHIGPGAIALACSRIYSSN